MGSQGYRRTYRVAFDQANEDLGCLFQEYERLQLRKEQIEEALLALEPFLNRADSPVHETIQQAQPVLPTESQEAPKFTPAEPIFHEEQIAEPVPPAPFVPTSDMNMDPIQRRINRALGLAVA